MADITTRETSGGGATVKNAPLTNAEVDTNFINLNVQLSSLATGSITETSESTLTNKIIDSVTNSVGADHIHFKVKATEALDFGDVVTVVGYNSGENAYEVAKVSASTDIAIGIMHDTLASGEFGAIVNKGLIEGVDTDLFSVGDILYPNTSGGLTDTRPTSGDYQACAFVLRSNSENGALLLDFTEPRDANLADFADAFTLPATDGTTGQALVTNGSGVLSFSDVDALPDQSGNSGKYLTTDGTDASWAELPAGGLEYVVKTANYTASDKEGVLADTSGGAFTVTLPATPATGAQVVVADSGGAFATNNLTVGRNGSTIAGESEDLVLDLDSVAVQFVYDGSTWEFYVQTRSGGGGDTADKSADGGFANSVYTAAQSIDGGSASG